MNHGVNATKAFLKDLGDILEKKKAIKEKLYDGSLEIAFFPPYVSLAEASSRIETLRGTFVGAQNVYHEENGAFTGEISVSMIKEIGCTHCIIGHSERRHIIGESNSLIARKMQKCTQEDIIPVFCYGETLEEREKGMTVDIIDHQLRSGLEYVESETINNGKVIFAYEPVWAIGTGRSAKAEDAQDICNRTRSIVSDLKGVEPDKLIVLYGGSVKRENAGELLNLKDVDGALVGGASLKVDPFTGIIDSWMNG